VHLNFSHLDNKKIKYVIDESPERKGRLIAGVNIPIIGREELQSDTPDIAILFAWNYETEVLAKEAEYRKRGGKFLIPLPTLHVK
jgi:hypothetical protein